jgi:hypothetical protein
MAGMAGMDFRQGHMHLRATPLSVARTMRPSYRPEEAPVQPRQMRRLHNSDTDSDTDSDTSDF